MNSIRLARLLVPALLLAALGSPLCADFNPALWQSFASVTAGALPTKSGQGGLVEVTLPPEILDISLRDLRDIRVIDSSGAEIPFYARHTLLVPQEPPQHFTADLLNLSFLPAKSTTVTADFRASFPRASIEVRTSGSDFRREVLVEASQDGKAFQHIRERALLFNATKDGRVEFERDFVTFPVNDSRFLRVTVFNSPVDKDVIDIRSITADGPTALPKRSDVTFPLDLGPGSISQDAANHTTSIEFDLLHRNLPLCELFLDFKEPNFFRRALLEGRDSKTTVVKFRREDNSPAERTVDTPWAPLPSYALFRYSSGGIVSDSNLSIPLSGAGARYLRLTIYNGDDAPLTCLGAKADVYRTFVRYPFQPARTCRLFFGNSNASDPSYDLAHFVGRLQSEGVVQAALGPVEPNPRYTGVVAVVPWSEQHRVILWIALVAVGLVLAFLIFRQARSVKEPTAPAP